MLTLISRTIGLVICVGLMMVGAKHTARELWNWKKAADEKKNVVA